MVKCGVLFEVRTEFLNIIYTSFGFKWLKHSRQFSLGCMYSEIITDHAKIKISRQLTIPVLIQICWVFSEMKRIDREAPSFSLCLLFNGIWTNNG
jgi:hypothetical protein